MDDVRYSELLFLRALSNGSLESVSAADQAQALHVGLDAPRYADMILTLAEDLYIQFDDLVCQLLVGRLRQEVSEDATRPSDIRSRAWHDPRSELYRTLTAGTSQRLRITYRGLRRLDELRDTLRNDRILDHFGVLLDLRYFTAELDDALERSAAVPVSVLYTDMDNFKPINDSWGHAAGDVVMKAYLEAVRDSIGTLGTAYRGTGDEVVVILAGQGHGRAVEVAERIRSAVSALRCRHQDRDLPRVTASIGVASTPPEHRSRDLVNIAEARNRSMKAQGKDRIGAE
jgi:diguanylate cyclase (GGDEF)-like protein